jgi:glycosyltransferase involved in cell wall biosynthesis
MNVLHLTTFYPPYSFGGDAMYIYRLSHALGDAGHHVDVVHCTDAYHLLHPAPPPIQFASHPNVTVHSLHSKLGWLSPLLTQQTGKPFLKRARIAEVARSRLYDVVHYHNISLLGPGILSLETPGSTPVKLYTTHEHWLVCPMHVLWKFNERACERPECLRCTLMAKRPPQWWRYTRLLEHASRHVDRFVSPSRFTARMHAERGFSQPVGHLPYFIDRADSDWQTPQPRRHPRNYFLFVGRLERLKGLQTLIAAWDRVTDYDLLVAGTGSEEALLRAQAAGNPRVIFLGAQSQSDLGSLYYHAVACIVPSITYETFGMIIIEAFARKTPVIVRDLGALPEVVEESGGGFIYRTDEQLVDAIHAVATSPTLRDALGAKGYDTFIKLWTREAHMHQYLALIEETRQDKQRLRARAAATAC